MTRLLFLAATLAIGVVVAASLLVIVGIHSVARNITDMLADDDPEDAMCPNCVTPWKCNGPHDPDDEPDWLAEFASIDRTHTRSTPKGPYGGYRITVGQPIVAGGN